MQRRAPHIRPHVQLALAIALVAALLFALAGVAASASAGSFRFAILGDRTGEAQPGVYEHTWRAVAAEHPAFAITVGDTIQGLNDRTARAEWVAAQRILRPYRGIPLYLVPGNHDIWSAVSEQLFRKYSAHAPHYSFNYGPAHFTVLDNSRTDQLPAEELAFLEQDLEANRAQPVKFIFSHRPSWLLDVALQNTGAPLHQLAQRFGVRYIIAGHVHQMLRFHLQGVEYLSMASSGGHLRASRKYADGWFFGHALVEIHGTDVDMRIEELPAPYGEGRVTQPRDWGMLGLAASAASDQRAAGGSRSVGIPAR